MSTFKALIADLWPIVLYMGRWVINGYSDIRVTMVQLLAKLLRGDFKNALPHAFWQLILISLRYPVQFVLTTGSLVLNALSSFINNVFRLANERYLNEHELQYLQPIFGANLEYAAIKIQTGGIKEKLGISPQAVGVDIFLRKHWGTVIVNDDLSLTPAGLRLLGHEACHVWQYQHRGAGYIGDSLITQVCNTLGSKIGIVLSDGYDVLPALRAKIKYEQCNVEQQAVMAELIGVVCCGREITCFSEGTLHTDNTSVDLLKRYVTQRARLTCDTFNKMSDLKLTDDEFVLIQSAHACLCGSEQGELTDQ